MQISRFVELEYQAAEAVNTLCANLSFAGGDFKRIMITSCRPQDGKSFVSMNLMRSMAKLGLKVLLIDADIRASALRGTYGINVTVPDGKRYMGLSGYLLGHCGISDIVGKTSIPGAYMILAGRTVANSLPLFNSAKMEHLLQELSRSFDIILVDTPPVGTLIDAAQIATYCNGALMVVRSASTTTGELLKAIEQLEKTSCPLIGYVLNRAHEKGTGKRYYYYRSKTTTKDQNLWQKLRARLK